MLSRTSVSEPEITRIYLFCRESVELFQPSTGTLIMVLVVLPAQLGFQVCTVGLPLIVWLILALV